MVTVLRSSDKFAEGLILIVRVQRIIYPARRRVEKASLFGCFSFVSSFYYSVERNRNFFAGEPYPDEYH